MKPKTDQINGYLTPQVSRRKSLGVMGSKTMSTSKLQDGCGASNLLNLDQGLVQKLLDDPIKRQLIVDIITSHKDQISEYKKTHGLEGVSMLHKVQTKPTCESPTALFRRRAIEQRERVMSRNESDSQSSNSRPNSALSRASVVPSPAPFNKILDGVIAFVEVQTNGNDRSKGVKVRIKEMGATVRDQLTKDVTHVIFKDGFFTTYKKAQLIKAHIISVLWIEACRNDGARVPEKRYPAIGPDIYDCNASALCSQMQKEYEEVIRDELNKSFTTGAPLPSKQDLINKRRTMMTPCVSNTLSQELPSSQDFEVAEIFRKSRRTLGTLYTQNDQNRQDSSDDDSDLRVVINGPVTKLKDISASYIFDGSDNIIDSSCMDFTELHGTVITSHTSQIPKQKENMQPSQVGISRKCPDLDRTKSSISSYATAQDSQSHKGSPTMRNTSNIKILSKNVCSPRVDMPNECVSSAMSTLQISDKTKTTGTTMSSLRVSSDSKAVEEQPMNDEYVTVRKKPAQNEGTAGCSPPKKKKTYQDSDLTPSGLVQSEERIGDVEIAKKNVNYEVRGTLDGEIQRAEKADIQSIRQLDKVKDRRKSKKPDNAVEASADAEKISTTSNNPTDRPTRTRKNIYNTIDNDDEKSTVSKTRKSKHLKEHTQKQTTPKETSSHKEKPSIDAESSAKPERVRRSLFTTTTDNSTGKRTDEHQTEDQFNGVKKKVRKLFNPDDIPVCEADSSDEQERKRMREKAKKRKTDGVFIRPTYINVKSNIFISQKAKEYMDEHNRNIDDVLNKQTDSDSDHKTTKTKKKQATQKKVVYDDRFSLTKGIFAKKDDEKGEKPTPTRKSIRLSRKPRKAIRSDHTFTTDSESEDVSPPKRMPPRRKTLGNVTQVTPKQPKSAVTSNTDTETGSASESNMSPPKRAPPRRKTLGNITKMTPKKPTSAITSKNDPKTPSNNRRSTLEFQSKDQMNSARRLKIDKLQKPTIVCTKLHRDDVAMFNQIVKKLGKFSTEDEVSSRTTHLVAGEPKRTINMLRAMARGCWILKFEWLLKSLEAQKWLPEEDFEETDFSPAVQQCRLQRQAFGPSYSMDVFQECGVIYVAKGSTPRCSDLRELIKLCGGNVTTIARNADIIVGGYQNRDDVTCVTEIWVLDSIKYNKRMTLKKYKIQSDNKVML